MTTMAHPNPDSIDQKSVMELESLILSLKTELQDRMTEIAMLKETGDAVSRELEKRVEERTAELLSANNQLRQEVSERERTEEKLKSFMDKLEQSNHELEDFAHVASHDLQEPLRKVTAFGDRLKAKYEKELGDQGRDYLERMQSAATRMQTLINGLLTYSRVTSKKQPFISVDLNIVVQEVLSDLEVRIEQTRGSVETGNLPEVFGDPLQMRQLMQNLIGNALKFTKKDEPPVIRISSRTLPAMKSGDPQEKGLYEITVQDQGIGFDEKYADRIFGVFQRLHGRGEYEGTGIGLSVCRKIVEHHGWSLEAKSQPGQGSAFVIRLPLNQNRE
ncbi:MAG: ATP-binding protein [bacterium]